MLTQLTHDIATMSRRRWLAATAPLVLGLAELTQADAHETNNEGQLQSQTVT